MREISVNYLLSNEDEERLQKITEEYKKRGMDSLEDKQFETIMLCGSKQDINKKFKFHEWKLGLREDWE